MCESIPKISFNKPYLTGREVYYAELAVKNGHLSGNGPFTKRCQRLFEERWGFSKCLFTSSCTDALEMCALLLDIQPGDEVIVPSYTFVSTALAFARQGAKIVFADSRADRPGLCEAGLESLVTPRTKVIVPVHYAGVACDMDEIMAIAERYGIFVVEDAAHCISSSYKGRPLGSIGHLSCFSFHETKNLHCGEGGMLAINDPRFVERAEIIWEKGTNRSKFFKGEVNKYEWVDTGSSFLASDLLAAFLLAQLEAVDEIQALRLAVWNWYNDRIDSIFPGVSLQKPLVPDFATNNAHMYYVVFESEEERDRQIHRFRSLGVQAIFHYLCLHKSSYATRTGGPAGCLPHAERFERGLLRLPLYCDFDFAEMERRLGLASTQASLTLTRT